MLSNVCRTAIVELQMNLRTKESKLEDCRRKGLNGTMETCTFPFRGKCPRGHGPFRGHHVGSSGGIVQINNRNFQFNNR